MMEGSVCVDCVGIPTAPIHVCQFDRHINAEVEGTIEMCSCGKWRSCTAEEVTKWDGDY
jgi:hypothetical protein